MELAFSGLDQLCAPMLDHVKRLPAPQRDALGTAFGLAGGACKNAIEQIQLPKATFQVRNSLCHNQVRGVVAVDQL